MTKIDIITKSGITASDGTILASGATVKFDSEFHAGDTKIRIILKIYRSRDLFDAGYDPVLIPEDVLPYDFILDIPEDEYYTLTPAVLYQKVSDYLNTLIPNMFEVQTITV